MKEYLKSSLITFVAGFALGVLPLIDDLSLESVRNGALLGVFFVGIRLGVKMVLEGLVTWYTKRND